MENKYIISKTDGTPVNPKAQYFVLRLDGDNPERAAARSAVIHFSESVKPYNDVASVAAFHIARKSEPSNIWRRHGYHGDDFLSTKTSIEEAFSRGETIQCRSSIAGLDADKWHDMAGNELGVETVFDWAQWHYRIKPEQEQPPISNDFVADGCEQFGSQEVAIASTVSTALHSYNSDQLALVMAFCIQRIIDQNK